MRFVRAVVDGKLKISNRKKAELVAQLQKDGYAVRSPTQDSHTARSPHSWAARCVQSRVIPLALICRPSAMTFNAS